LWADKEAVLDRISRIMSENGQSVPVTFYEGGKATRTEVAGQAYLDSKKGVSDSPITVAEPEAARVELDPETVCTSTLPLVHDEDITQVRGDDPVLIAGALDDHVAELQTASELIDAPLVVSASGGSDPLMDYEGVSGADSESGNANHVVNSVSSSAPDRTVAKAAEIEEEDLPFPGFGCGDDEEASTDNKPILTFDNVIPEPQVSQPSGMRQGKGKHGKSPAELAFSGETAFKDEKRRSEANSHTKPNFSQHSSAPRQGFGPSYGAGYGGSPYMNNRQQPFSPQSFSMDLGIGHMVRGVGNAGRSLLNTIRRPGIDPHAIEHGLNESIACVDVLRSRLAAGVDDAGSPLSQQAVEHDWLALNEELESLSNSLSAVQKLSRSGRSSDSLKSIRHAAQSIKETAALAKQHGQSSGRVGELATQAHKVAEALSEALMKIINAILRVFSKDRAPSP
jgi:hypothetical protein